VFRYGVQKESLGPALVEDDLLDPAVAVWVPEVDLEHVVGLAPDAVGEVEAVEDFEAAALEAVGLAVEDLRGVLLVEDLEWLIMVDTFVLRLSMIRVLMLSLLIHSAVMRPAGPAPTMRTSIWEVLAGDSPMVMAVELL